MSAEVVRPVKLETRQLQRNRLEANGIEGRFDQREPNIACCDRPNTGMLQNRLEHRDDRGFPVRPRDREPRRAIGLLHAARKLDLRPDLDAFVLRGNEKRVIGPPPGRRDNDVEGGTVGVRGKRASVLLAEQDPGSEGLEYLGTLEVRF